jgi:NAD-specific glutamate dehydrogenase
LALVVGGVATFVLALSIWECTAALAVLTGMPLALAAMLAVGIDCGMVVCEIVAVAQCTKEEARRWAERYVHLAVGMSVMLNAVAAASHAEGWWKVAGATAGALVPILIYIAGRVAGNSWAGR